MGQTKEEIDVCKAIIDLQEDARREGKLEGYAELLYRYVGKLSCDLEQGLDDLEIPESDRPKVIEIVKGRTSYEI